MKTPLPVGFCLFGYFHPMTRQTRAHNPATASARAPSSASTTQRPDPEAWALARLYANGDTTRLEVVDALTVRVRNHPA